MPPQDSPETQAPSAPQSQPAISNPAAGLDPLDMPPMPVERSTGAAASQLKLFQIITVAVGALAVILLVTTLVFATKSSKLAAESSSQYNNGLEAGKKQQKEDDTVAFNKELTSSTRTYEAPTINGGFQLSFPKAWSLSVDSTSSTPVDGFVNPGFVTLTSPEQALRFTLINTPYETTKKSYDNDMKNNGSKRSDVTVSGIKGVQYVGKINEKSKEAVGTVTIVPLRDKTMLIQTDSNKLYSDAYAQMLQTAKLVP